MDRASTLSDDLVDASTICTGWHPKLPWVTCARAVSHRDDPGSLCRGIEAATGDVRSWRWTPQASGNDTYITQARVALVDALGGFESSWRNEKRLLDLYTLLVLVKGQECTSEDIHDAWAVARQRTRPDHSELIPFGQLPRAVQLREVRYRDAVRTASARSAAAAS